ncbi:unnamed protein product [Prunus armeniaca]|uniref:Uncharacterized protein n=1 Tax=Prunus armeniaca TaxID=36596 RepID=A0A6J5URG7_PRUAR|nr:unnamed protein product [Prunus armeniaca]
MRLPLAIAWLFGGLVGVLDLKWYEHDAEVKACGISTMQRLRLGFGCFQQLEDEVQGIGMAKAWCFLAQGKLASLSLFSG